MSVVEMCTIMRNDEIADNIFELTLKGELVQQMEEPGQFVHVKVSNDIYPLLRRPLSIANIDQVRSEFTLIYRRQGKGTAVLASRKAGEKVDILGPLGQGFPVSETGIGQTALIVGGGIGIPPLYELSNQLIENGANVIHILGFQNSKAMFYIEQFQKLGHTLVSTVDGSYGIEGYVTTILAQLNLSFDTVYACGPHAMLKALKAAIPDRKMYISLEERMGCGIGACYGCVCPTSDAVDAPSFKKVCSDGPVFAAGEVVL